ncbi:hypothetical protein D6C91_02398 [Aureobasidium pullulans]|uniref:Uncharacterized protein n=1 Tax=Aureobasidium pullulans TaxID=5580 RepID=A0A4S9TQ93_AURPU|nr:hypothetical protein D6C91_02398 [Aureobasidium pullulans]
MLSFSLLALASVASFATAVPSDQSGTAQFALSCSGITVPDVVAQSGTSYFTSSLKFFPDGGDGDAIPATACTDESSTCSNCLFEGGGLSSPTNVTGCWNPPAGQAGCSVSFQYNGYDFDTQNKQPYCGHKNEFQPFASDLTALCYFNVDQNYSGA